MDREEALNLFGYESFENPSGEEVKHKYHDLAKEYHPDHNKTINDTQFKKLNNAYKILKEPKKETLTEKEPVAKDDPGTVIFEQNTEVDREPITIFDISIELTKMWWGFWLAPFKAKNRRSYSQQSRRTT